MQMSSILAILTLVVATLLSDGHNQRKIHECIHDKLNTKSRLQKVNYFDHPFEKIRNYELNDIVDRRKLIEDADYQNIRITPHYDTATISTSNGLTNAQITFIKQLISASIKYFESFIKVIPVDGPLFIEGCPYTSISQTGSFLYESCTSQTIDLKCGNIATIPDEHLRETWIYDTNTQKSILYRSAGSGIADTDLVIYVTYGNINCGRNTLAYASACTQDQYGRPVAGSINFCPLILDSEYWKFDLVTTMHELSHILIMSKYLWNYFYDYDAGQFRSGITRNASESGTDNTWIITDKVKEIARSHFGCDTLIGAPVESLDCLSRFVCD